MLAFISASSSGTNLHPALSSDNTPHLCHISSRLTQPHVASRLCCVVLCCFRFHPFYLSNVTKYVDEILHPQWHDLIDNYKPDILWCDGEWSQNSTTWRSLDFLTYLYNDSPVKDTIVTNDRYGSDTRGVHGGFYTAEYSAEVFDRKWEENSGIDLVSAHCTHTTLHQRMSTQPARCACCIICLGCFLY